MDRIDIDKIIIMYTSGLMAKEIAKQLNMKTQSVQYHLRVAGVRKRKKVNIEELAELYKNGMTAKEVGDKFGISESGIRERFKRFNKVNKNKINKNKRHNVNHHIFGKFTPESCYWAGFLAADGWVYAKQRKIGLELKKSDQEHIKSFCKFAERDTNLYYRTKKVFGKSFDSASILLASQQMINDLCNNFNVVPNKSLILQPPQNIPKHLRKHFIRGYIDGDGCISWVKKYKCARLEISSGSEQILKWVKGIICEETDKSGNPSVLRVKNRRLYRLAYSGNAQALNILDWLYTDSTKDTRLQRKYERYQEYSKTR